MKEIKSVYGNRLVNQQNLVNVIGNLDNTYFAYYEDIDYSIRSIRSGFINRTCLITRIKHGCRLNSIDEKRTLVLSYGEESLFVLAEKRYFKSRIYFRLYTYTCRK